MKSFRIFRLAVFAALLTAQLILGDPGHAAEKAPAPKVAIKVTVDRASATYRRRESVVFTIDVRQGGKPLTAGEVSYILDDEGPNRFKTGKLKLTGKPLTINYSMAEAGFLRCLVTHQPKGGKAVRGIGAAAIAPLEIGLSLPVPDDFDAFWKKQKATLAKVPMKSKLTPVEDANKSIEVFDAQIDSIGDVPVSGYFGRPKKAAKGSLPIVLWVHGAGVRSSSKGNAVKGAKEGFLSMDINAHGIPNGKLKKFYSDLASGKLKSYSHAGRENRDTIYFRGMFLRIVRALDFLTAQPEWNGKVVAVIGHSQGGAQALVAGGLDPRVTFIGSGVPAMCDHSGRAANRINGWPKIVPMGADGKPDPKILEAARYYDAVNFASRFKGEAIVSAGFIDTTCPATTCYAAYNQLKGKKRMIDKPQMGHAAPRDVQDAFWAAAKKHAGK
jgi:cephalosporin-C deacetylase